MRLLILGGNGRTGKWIVEESLSRGHEVVALVRNANSLAPQTGLTVIEGTPTRQADYTVAANRCDAVLVALNNPRKSDAPWSKPLTPEPILTNAAKNIAAGSIKRVVFLSALGVGDSFNDAPFILRFLIRNTNLGNAYADHNGVQEVMTTSGLDWTLVRASGLSNNLKVKKLVVGTAKQPKPGMMIRRKAVAEFMLECAEKNSHIHGTPVISER